VQVTRLYNKSNYKYLALNSQFCCHNDLETEHISNDKCNTVLALQFPLQSVFGHTFSKTKSQ